MFTFCSLWLKDFHSVLRKCNKKPPTLLGILWTTEIKPSDTDWWQDGLSLGYYREAFEDVQGVFDYWQTLTRPFHWPGSRICGIKSASAIDWVFCQNRSTFKEDHLYWYTLLIAPAHQLSNHFVCYSLFSTTWFEGYQFINATSYGGLQ